MNNVLTISNENKIKTKTAKQLIDKNYYNHLWDKTKVLTNP